MNETQSNNFLSAPTPASVSPFANTSAAGRGMTNTTSQLGCTQIPATSSVWSLLYRVSGGGDAVELTELLVYNTGSASGNCGLSFQPPGSTPLGTGSTNMFVTAPSGGFVAFEFKTGVPSEWGIYVTCTQTMNVTLSGKQVTSA